MGEFEDALKEVIINSEHDSNAKEIVQEIRDSKEIPRTASDSIDLIDLLEKVLTKKGIDNIEEYIFDGRKKESQSAGNTETLV